MKIGELSRHPTDVVKRAASDTDRVHVSAVHAARMRENRQERCRQRTLGETRPRRQTLSGKDHGGRHGTW